MAVKIYSDVTNKFYDNEAAALKAEEEVKKAQDEKTARRKKMAETVDAKRKAYDKARNQAEEADIKEFVICGERESQILGRD